MAPVYSLDDRRVADPAVGGSKAAALALARAAGLPVAPGSVVPVDVGTPVLRAGAVILADRGRSAAVLDVSETVLTDGLARRLGSICRGLGGRTIVRSSSIHDLDPRWSGAFGTYGDVSPGEMPAAVRGCWASAFSRGVLHRCETMGVLPQDLRIAILIQPWVRFDHGGTAIAHDDGSVDVVWAAAPPSDVVSGRSVAVTTRVAPDDDVEGDTGPLVRRVARLTRAARAATGEASIEWGAVRGDVALLQVRRAVPPPSVTVDPARQNLPPLPETAERLAVVVSSHPGSLADRLVVPWALALKELPPSRRIDVHDPAAALPTILADAEELTAAAWGLDADVASVEAQRVLRAARGPDPAESFGRLGRLRPVDPAVARRILGLVEGLGQALVARGALSRPDQIWRLTAAELGRAVENPYAAPERLGPAPWEPFVADVVMRNGRADLGTAVGAGVGAGRVHVPDPMSPGWRPGPRAILAVPEPLSRLSPLLWGAAGLVCAGGGAGAHLFEVARSLGVPSVIGVDLAPSVGSLAAVDGDRGLVAVLPGARPWVSNGRDVNMSPDRSRCR